MTTFLPIYLIILLPYLRTADCYTLSSFSTGAITISLHV